MFIHLFFTFIKKNQIDDNKDTVNAFINANGRYLVFKSQCLLETFQYCDNSPAVKNTKHKPLFCMPAIF